MPQKTNLNISPYYDDFDKDKNYYKVLFQPGYPVQARELIGLQSILQNQVESFGKHIFKEGSMVIPGGIEYDPSYFAAKINPTHLGIDVSVYLNEIIANNDGKGTRVRGQNSGIVATIKNFILPPTEGVDEITLFVKYVESGDDGESAAFPDGEILVLEETITYGNTTLNINETVLTLLSENATATGSAFGVNKGVYFIRGTFVDVPTSLIILEPYSTSPSYRVGFEIIEEIVNANEDSSLFDNAKGFTNFAAPGADRFKITVQLAKKALTDFNDVNFIELFRTSDGLTKKLQDSSVYSQLRKYFAARTYDESGDYSVAPFRVNTQNSLNDEVDSGGLYIEDQLTEEGNNPSDDLMCVKLSPGKAYVRGYDVYKPGSTIIDVEKPRDTKSVLNASISFDMGSVIQVNNASGTPFINIGGSNTNVVTLRNERKGASAHTASGSLIGEARVYSYNATDAAYSGPTTNFDLHLYDIQTFTILKCASLTNITATQGMRVRGLGSGAIGYLARNKNATGNNELAVSQTTGTFISGEQVILNERTISNPVSVKEVISYSIEDIKSIRQDTFSATGISTFNADTKLYDFTLPNFSIADELNITDNTASVNNRNFGGTIGINTGTIISYNNGAGGDPHFNRISDITADGKTITLNATTDVAGICEGSNISGFSTSSPFLIKAPKLRDVNSSISTKLPRRNIATVDTSNSNLIITKQIANQVVSSKSLTITSQAALNASSGITSAFFEPFDEEKYSIIYQDGTIEPLTSDQVSITNGGNDITFTGLKETAAEEVTVNVTLKKIGAISRSKDYLRSEQIEITRTVGVSTLTSLLVPSDIYGLRVEDREISLNVPDVVKIHAVYESKDTSTPTLDGLTFVSGLSLDTNAIIGEKIVGKDSRAVGQIVAKPNATEIRFVYLNANKFTVGELINFKESSIETVLQGIITGNFVDRTNNFLLDTGHKAQYCDYSKIVRKAKSAIPSKKLLVIFDRYEVASGSSGDFFSVNSYTKDRYANDIPAVEGIRLTDLIDFRPRVNAFSISGNKSPFAFTSRSFETTNPYVITPKESSVLGYSFYLPRIDKLVINQFEEVKLIKGESSESPVPPTENGNSMEVAQIALPAYLFDTVRHPIITLQDNKRFTMRDISALEQRIENLETMTSLSALELDTKSLQVTDASGLNRFKTGFVVNNFKDRSFIDFDPETGSQCDVDVVNQELISTVDFWSIKPELGLDPAINPSQADLNSNLRLLDTNCKKTGDLVTLDYEEVDWLDQPHATGVENVNPFSVIVFMGGIILDPPSDNWTRTIYVENVRKESTGATWAEVANSKAIGPIKETKVGSKNTGKSVDDPDSDWYRHRIKIVNNIYEQTQKFKTTYKNVLEGPSKEYDYVESVKTTSEVDPYMRSRNVFFNANGLKPLTRHYHYLDNGIPDITPKLIEIEMVSGTFTAFEDIKVTKGGDRIGLMRIQRPNHKFGDQNRPDVEAGLGAPAVTVEEYSVDPYDKNRPAPSSAYSATSKLLNIDCVGLANEEKYYGYIKKGARIVGEQSGAVAKVTKIRLRTDNWGDLLGTFFFRDPNTTPKPPQLFETGTKTFRVTAAKEGTIPVPGSTDLASDAIGVFTGTGTLETTTTNTVQVRNPPPPSGTKPTEITYKTNTIHKEELGKKFTAPHRDPLAQSFTVDETGAFLTSFDVYFRKIDPQAKLFVELREVELGTPTRYLVQDYTQLSINPATYNNGSPIETSEDASVATTFRFPSPVYLEPEKEYAIVFLAPASDKYEMWVATMGEKTVKTNNLPNAENVVVSKQYIGGSLFKSQNGTIWTASQFQDLTFKLRKAKFVQSGTTTFYNTPIEPGNLNTSVLRDNPIRSLPRKLIVKLGGSGAKSNNEFPIGRKVSTGASNDAEDVSITGIIEGQGAAIDAVEKVLSGSGYAFSNANTISLRSLTGSGSGATADFTLTNITGGPQETIDSISNVSGGTGYQVGDVLTINNDDVKVLRGSGAKFTVTSINSTFNTLYLTDVQGDKFTSGETLVHYNTDNQTRTVVTNTTVNGDSTVQSNLFTGDVFEVTQYNHAHHGATNKIVIQDVQPDTTIVPSTQNISVSSGSVTIANTTPFTSYAGVTTDRGFAQIGEEVVSYVTGTNQLSLTARGLFGTKAVDHEKGTSIQTYEASGMPLTGINTTHTIPTDSTLFNAMNIDNYYLKVDVNAVDSTRTGKELLCFTNEKAFGGKNVGISQNHQFSTFNPQINAITPGNTTRISTSVRTISGTSADGTEVSFIDQGFDAAGLNQTVLFPTPRIVASTVNESERLSNLPKNKSLTVNLNMTSGDPNLSPVVDTKNAQFILGRNKINNPIGFDNYASDPRTTQIEDDPHGSVFISQKVNLEQPATSLKVLIGASVQPESDFRVYYRLFSADSTEVSQNYRPFPGYKNLIDTDGDGFGDDVIDSSLNDGRADAFVESNSFGKFSEYQFTKNNLEQFTGFKIKIVMMSSNESYPVKLRDFRAIALA